MDNETSEASFEGDPPAAAEPEALLDRRELSVVAVERTRMPMVITDPRQHDNPIVLANNAFLELTGYRSDEVLGRNCRFLQGDETDPPDVEAIRRGLQRSADHFEVELLNYRKNGSSFWNQLHVSPVQDDAGELLYYFASQKDISARRRAQELEAAERLLLAEVDHRAMNALALVQSMVNLTRTDSPERYAASIRGRIAAISRAHRLLAASAWSGAPLRPLIEGELPHPMRERVLLKGDAIVLPAPLVQPLSLVLHELLSNALRHGSLSREAGTVEVTWKVEGGRLLLSWHETGTEGASGLVEASSGLKMVEGVVGRQLCGKVATSLDSGGFRAELNIPTGEGVDLG
jgi:PAS domain S-box-containing protein